MNNFKFTKESVDLHVQTVGVDVRPLIDVEQDRTKLQEFYNRAIEKFPHFVEGLDQRPKVFQLTKTIRTPKGLNVTVPTFQIAPRGPLFTFPITQPGVLDDYEWSQNVNADIVECLEVLQSQIPTAKFIRIGKRRELVYYSGKENADQIVARRFARGLPDGAERIEVAWSKPTDLYNQNIRVKGMQQQKIEVRNVGGIPTQTVEQAERYGVNVVLDINNRRTNAPLDSDQLRIILDHADQVYVEEFLRILNGEQE